jgi:hypothetical protein
LISEWKEERGERREERGERKGERGEPVKIVVPVSAMEQGFFICCPGLMVKFAP